MSGGAAFVETGPPPNRRQRQLIFDSLCKIVDSSERPKGRPGGGGTSRGTFVFTWGAGYQGQLGKKKLKANQTQKSSSSKTRKYSTVPLIVDLDVVVRTVVCGPLHTCVVTDGGQLYQWGNGDADPSETKGGEGKEAPWPRMISALASVFVVSVACGQGHTVALTDQGRVWAWGKGKLGQLGFGEDERPGMSEIAKEISDRKVRNIVQIACGNLNTMCLDREGRVISFGCSKHGQTGIGEKSLKAEEKKERPVNIFEPMYILGVPRMKYIACGPIHSTMVSQQGDLYACGFGEFLYPCPEADAQRQAKHFSYDPVKITVGSPPEPVIQVACGQSHCLALAESGNVYAWGSGEYGQIGHGIFSPPKHNIPVLVLLGKDISTIACGRYHSMALTRDGFLYAWGCGENGQLGLNSDFSKKIPEIVTPISGAVVGQVSCGEHHTAVLTSAPWTHASKDVNLYMQDEIKEIELKHIFLLKHSHGISKRRLQEIRREFEVAKQTKEEKKMEEAEKDRKDQVKDLNSIAKKSTLRATLREELKSGTTTLPSVAGTREIAPEDLDGGPQSGRGKTAANRSLPAVKTTTKRHKPKSALSLSQQPEDEDGKAPQKGLARVAFLKETAAVIKNMTAIVQDKGESMSKATLQRMLKDVYGLRKEYDVLKHTRTNKNALLENETKENELLDKAMKLSEKSMEEHTARKNELEMKLNTVTIKIAEVEENRKNYENNIGYLISEDFEKNDKLKALRKKTGDTNTLYKKVNEMRIIATEERDKVEHELENFHKEINGYQTFVKTQLEKFESVLDIVRAQNEKRERTQIKRRDKSRAVAQQRVKTLETEAKQSEDQNAKLNEDLSALELKLRHFEDNFQKITAATGLTDPDGIVKKFQFKGEIKEQLSQEIDDKQQLIVQLKEEEQEKKKELEEVKANFSEDRWRDVEVLEEGNRGVDHKRKKKRKDLDKITARLAFAQEGLSHLMMNIATVLKVDEEPEPENAVNSNGLWTEEKALKLCEYLETHSERLNAEGTKFMEEKEAREQKKREEEEAAQKTNKNGPQYSLATLAATTASVEKSTQDSARQREEEKAPAAEAEAAAPAEPEAAAAE